MTNDPKMRYISVSKVAEESGGPTERICDPINAMPKSAWHNTHQYTRVAAMAPQRRP